MSILIDTNILLYAHDEISPKNKVARDLVEKAIAGRVRAVVAHQNLLEFVAVITQDKRVVKSLTLENAVDQVERLLSGELDLISPNNKTLTLAKNFLKSLKIKGGKVFDVYLVATMLTNGIKAIYTDNDKDFVSFREIKVVNPFK